MKTICLIILFSIVTFVVSAQVMQQKASAQKDSDTIRLRCNASVASNAMLYIVDGVLVTKKDVMKLSPADIVSIDVLKDPEREMYFCRKPSPVLIITTKKANRKLFVVVDAKTNVGISAASIHIGSAKTSEAIDFIADGNGRFETDSLFTNESLITVTATGYEPLHLTVKQAKQEKYRFQLKPKFLELKEIYVVAYRTIKCSRGYFQLPASKINFIKQEASCDFYRVGVKQKGIVNVETMQLAEQKMSVYPNPVAKGSSVRFSFLNIKPGIYQVRLFNNSGQLVHSFQKQISGKNETEQIHLSSQWAAGMYIVQVTDENKKPVQTTKLALQ